MQKLVITLLLLLLPVTAFAHPGHEHVGDSVSHHLFEYAVLITAAVLITWFANRIYAARASKRQP